MLMFILDGTSGFKQHNFPHLQGMQYNQGIFRPTFFTGQEAGCFVAGMCTNFMLSVDKHLVIVVEDVSTKSWISFVCKDVGICLVQLIHFVF
jgi:hypothetical protein